MEKLSDIFMFLIIVFLLGYGVLTAIYSLTTEQICLENGWKEGVITWNLQRYCSREENEYEITKPLKEIINN